jgi:hypothetical protein
LRRFVDALPISESREFFNLFKGRGAISEISSLSQINPVLPWLLDGRECQCIVKDKTKDRNKK